MSIHEPRCLVCGAPLDKATPFNRNPRISECCSDECYKEYMTDDEGICHIGDLTTLKHGENE